METYDLLMELIDSEDLITSVYYKEEFKLNIKETLDLMKNTHIMDFSDNIVLYGDDFKIIKIETDNIQDSFLFKVSLKKPNKKKEFKPFTLDSYKFLYSDEFQTPVPFKTIKMLEEEEKEKKEAEEFKKQREEEKWNKFINYMEDLKSKSKSYEILTDKDIFSTFSGGKSDSCEYITVPKLPVGNYEFKYPNIKDENFLTYDDRKLFDFAGYVAKINGNLEIIEIITPFDSNSKYIDYFNEFISNLITENKITFVIGSAPETFYFYRLKERPKGFIERVKKDIIKYYKN